jgi:hypothetical protein
MLKNCIQFNFRKITNGLKPVNLYNLQKLDYAANNLKNNFLKYSHFFFSNKIVNFPFKNFSTNDEQDTHNHSSKEVDEMFIKDSPNEILPIKQKIADLIAENEEFQEYNRMVNMVKTLSSEFDLDKFKEVIAYINDNQVTDVFLFKQFESIFIQNLNLIDYQAKATCVLMLGDYVNKKKTSFQEENWLKILKDFQGLVELIGFNEYYNYIITFDRLFNKKKVHDLGGKYTKEFDYFITFQNMTLFNSGKIEMKKLDDIFLFSKLTHNGVLKMSNISDNVWFSINKIVQTYASEMNIYELLIITSLFINYQEVSGKAIHILSDAIREVNNYLYSLINNFDLLDYQEQENIINYADNLFNYFSLFMYVKRSKEEPNLNNFEFLKSLIKIYTEKLKSKNHDFMIFKEFRILQLLSKEVKYRDQEFWSLIAEKTMEYINKDFMKILNDIFPKRLLKNSTMSDEDKARFQEKCDMQLLLYIGMIVETFTSADYVDKDFWDVIFQKVDHFANFKTRDIFVILNFISLGCKKMYKKENFTEIWGMFINLLDPKVQPIFLNKDVVDFLVKMNNYKEHREYREHKESSERATIKIEDLNKSLNALFLNPVQNATGSIDVPYIKLFSSFFFLIENKIKDDEKVKDLKFNNLLFYFFRC